MAYMKFMLLTCLLPFLATKGSSTVFKKKVTETQVSKTVFCVHLILKACYVHNYMNFQKGTMRGQDCTDLMRNCISDDTYTEVPDVLWLPPDSSNGCRLVARPCNLLSKYRVMLFPKFFANESMRPMLLSPLKKIIHHIVLQI